VPLVSSADSKAQPSFQNDLLSRQHFDARLDALNTRSSAKSVMQHTRVIFFDLGKTLVTGTEMSARRLLGSYLSLSEKETSRVGKVIMTCGALDFCDLANAVGQILPRFDSNVLHEAIRKVWFEQLHSVREVPGAVRVLKKLKENGFRIGFISNTWHPFWLGFNQVCQEMKNMAEYIFLSYQLGIKKPSPRLYMEAVKAAGETAQSCAMVGDSYELDIAPAQLAQMTTVWLLGNLEAEKGIAARVMRGEMRPPNWAAEDLESVLQFFVRTGRP
jgi:FMN phosphatase YigB (HAD superfamily)